MRCADSGKQFELGSVNTAFTPSLLPNLDLSMLAAIQAPIVLMSQNKQAEKDRLYAEHNYEVKLKAELESGASIDRPIPFCSVTHRIAQLISGAYDLRCSRLHLYLAFRFSIHFPHQEIHHD